MSAQTTTRGPKPAGADQTRRLALVDPDAPEVESEQEPGFSTERIAQSGRTPTSAVRTLVESQLYPVPGSIGYYYSEEPGTQGLYKKGTAKPKPSDDENMPKPPVWTMVLPRVPIVTENYVELGDSGAVVRQYFSLAAGRDVAPVVKMADLRTGEAWEKLPDLVGLGSRTMRDLMVSIVSDQAERVTRMYAVKRTGIHTINGRRVYVYPDGRTYPDGPRVRVIDAKAELIQAVAPLGEVATDEQIRQALTDIAGHGWQPLLSLGLAARTFGYSIRSVPGGAAFRGEQGSGKTLSAGIGRQLILTCGYPPLATAAFAQTITDLECNVAVEADMPVLIDDLALTAESSQLEINEGKTRVEMLFRAAGNNRAMRGRRRKDLTAAEENRLGSVPLITAQLLPKTMQASLYRRAILPEVIMGDVDTAWYLAKETRAWDTLNPALRTLGDRIIARLIDSGEEAGPWLDRLAVDAQAQFGPVLDLVLPVIAPQVETVIVLAVATLVGLLMIADVCGMDRTTLLGPVLGPLAQTVAAQSAVIADKQETSDNLAVAVSDMVRAALLSKRAHVRDHSGVICPCVPGQTEQAQGVTKVPGSGEFGKSVEWNGSGAAFYYDPAIDVLKVRGTELHSLTVSSTDQRVKGYSGQTLPAELLRAGASRAGTQKDRPATNRERVPGDGSLANMVHLRGSVIWQTGEDEPELPAKPAATAPQLPAAPAEVEPSPAEPAEAEPAGEGQITPEAVDRWYAAIVDDMTAARTVPELEALGNDVRSDSTVFPFSAQQLDQLRKIYTARLAQLRPAPAATIPAPRPEPKPAAAPARTAGKGSAKAKAAAAEVAGPRTTDAVGIDLVAGELVGYPHPLPAGTRTVAAVMEWAAGLDLGAAKIGQTWFRHDGIVYVSSEAAAKLGLPAAAPKPKNRHVTALTAAGWQIGAAGLAGYTSLWRGEGTDRISRRLVILPYLAADRPAAPEFTTMAADDQDATPVAAKLARRQNQFGRLVGTPMGFTGATTGMALLRARRPERLPKLDDDGKYVRDEITNKMMFHQAPYSVAMGGTPMPLPIMHGSHPEAAGRTPEQTCKEEDYAWSRGLTEAEQAMGFALGLDTMTSFASVLERLIVPLGEYEHVSGSVDPTGKGMAGFGFADLSGIEVEPELPHFATASGERPAGPEWYALGTLKYARTAYGWTGQTSEAYLTDRAGALFEPWWPPIRDAYLSLMASAGVGADLSPEAFLTAYAGYKGSAEADTLALLGMVKSLYKMVVGKFRQGPGPEETVEHWLEKKVSSPWHRSDIRAYVLSAARTMAHHRYRKTYRAVGRAPFAVWHDCAVYASPSGDPLELVAGLVDPAGRPLSGAIRLGVRPGSMKFEGSAPMADLLARAADTRQNPAMLVTRYTDGTYAEKGNDDGE